MNEESHNFFNGTQSTSTSSSAASITAFKDLKGLENGLAVPRESFKNRFESNQFSLKVVLCSSIYHIFLFVN